MDLGASTVFEEEIVFVTAADDELDFTSNDNIFFKEELCVPFSTHLFPHHDKDNIIQYVSQSSTLQEDVLHAFASPSFKFVASMSSTPLPDCFNQVPVDYL